MVILLRFVFLCLFCGSLQAAELRLAVASNFSDTAEKLKARFQEKTGHRLSLSFGSTSKLFTQIKNGAPFDVFLAADETHPKKLIEEGLAQQDSYFIYALGKLVLWSPNKTNSTYRNPTDVLRAAFVRHLALANPDLAPYGVAAKSFLLKFNLWKLLQPKMIFGENISQTFQFIESGNAELGFVAASQVNTRTGTAAGVTWPIDEALYSALKQGAVVLNRAVSPAAVTEWMSFLKSPTARSLIIKAGYGVVNHE